MSSDYLCMGCGLPIHWFFSAGDPVENEGKGHSAHYWCRTCHAKKVVQAQAAHQKSYILGTQQHLNPLLLHKNLVLS
jgi:hypothetical protein